jgi:group I intron endonuclease
LFYVYVIENAINGKLYVGITNNPRKRWNQHLREMRKGSNLRIYLAMRKYGRENFEMFLVETAKCRYVIHTKEQYWIRVLGTFGRNGYNMTAGGYTSSNGNKIRFLWKSLSTEEKWRRTRGMIESNTPEIMSARTKRYQATLTPEQRSENSRKGQAKRTFEDRQRAGKIAAQTSALRTPEQKVESQRKRLESFSPERRSAAAKSWKRNVKEISERASRTWANKTPEEKEKWLKSINNPETSQKRSQKMVDRHAAKTAKERSDQARKNWANKSTEERKNHMSFMRSLRTEDSEKQRVILLAEAIAAKHQAIAENFAPIIISHLLERRSAIVPMPLINDLVAYLNEKGIMNAYGAKWSRKNLRLFLSKINYTDFIDDKKVRSSRGPYKKKVIGEPAPEASRLLRS